MKLAPKLLLVTSFLIITAILGWVLWQKNELKQEEHVHMHAGFQVYIDGVKQDYSAFEFMSISPCSTEKKRLTSQEAQLEKAHLHDQVGEVVHVHTKGATWEDLFKNIRQDFGDKEVKAYRDEEPIIGMLSQPIQVDDSLVFLVGNQENIAELIKSKVSIESIKEVEKKSELCGTQDHKDE